MANYYFISGDPSTAAAWSLTSGGAGGAGVPTASDPVYFTSGSSDFTLTADFVCGGFYSVSGFASTVNLGAYTVTNYGGADFRYFTAANFTATSSIWKQAGGTSLTDRAMIYFLNIAFGSFEFIANSYHTIGSATSVWGHDFTVNGYIYSTFTASFTLTGGSSATRSFTLGSSGCIETTTNMSVLYGPILGTWNTDTFKTPLLILTAYASIAIMPLLDINSLQLNSSSVAGSTFNFASGSIIRGTLHMANMIAVQTANFNGLQLYGDLIVTLKGAATGSFVTSGILELAGTGDQSLTAEFLPGVSLSANKPAGKASFLSGNFTLSDDFTIADESGPAGSLVITGTASLAGNGQSVTAGSFDSSMTTGTVTMGTLTSNGNVTAGASTTIAKIIVPKTAGQTIDVSQQTSAVEILMNGYLPASILINNGTVHFDRPGTAETVNVTIGGNVGIGGEQEGTIRLFGSGRGYIDEALMVKLVDTSEFTGIWDPTTGTLIEHRDYIDHFYVGKLYVQSSSGVAGIDVSNTGVVQNANRI